MCGLRSNRQRCRNCRFWGRENSQYGLCSASPIHVRGAQPPNSKGCRLWQQNEEDKEVKELRGMVDSLVEKVQEYVDQHDKLCQENEKLRKEQTIQAFALDAATVRAEKAEAEVKSLWNHLAELVHYGKRTEEDDE